MFWVSILPGIPILPVELSLVKPIAYRYLNQEQGKLEQYEKLSLARKYFMVSNSLCPTFTSRKVSFFQGQQVYNNKNNQKIVTSNIMLFKSASGSLDVLYQAMRIKYNEISRNVCIQRYINKKITCRRSRFNSYLNILREWLISMRLIIVLNNINFSVHNN